MDLEIKYIDINNLTEYEQNAKLHPDEQIEQIAASIKEFGMNDPIAVWGENNTIVEGHGRLMACKKLEIEKVPIISLDELSDEQRRAYMLAHNQTTLSSGFDFDMLSIELEGISEIDMELFGFEIGGGSEEPEVIEDNYDKEPPAKPKAKLGEIYRLGRHRLMCGDSTSVDDIDKLMNGDKAVLFLSDPPYGVDIVQNNSVGGENETHFGTVGGGKIVGVNQYMPIKGDDTTETAQMNYNIVSQITDNQIIFGGNYFTDFLEPKACWLVWDKENTGNFADVELAWTSFDKGAKLYRWLWNGLCRKGDRNTEGKSRVHPTQKPVGLMGEILKDFSDENDTILDCFGGSGSTLIACEQLNRICYMMEYEPHYVDVIIGRWEKFTGKKAVLL